MMEKKSLSRLAAGKILKTLLPIVAIILIFGLGIYFAFQEVRHEDTTNVTEKNKGFKIIHSDELAPKQKVVEEEIGSDEEQLDQPSVNQEPVSKHVAIKTKLKKVLKIKKRKVVSPPKPVVKNKLKIVPIQIRQVDTRVVEQEIDNSYLNTAVDLSLAKLREGWGKSMILADVVLNDVIRFTDGLEKQKLLYGKYSNTTIGARNKNAITILKNNILRVDDVFSMTSGEYRRSENYLIARQNKFLSQDILALMAEMRVLLGQVDDVLAASVDNPFVDHPITRENIALIQGGFQKEARAVGTMRDVLRAYLREYLGLITE